MIDTLTISRELRKAGFSEQQADALASIESRKQEDLATKTDINDLKADMNDLKADMKSSATVFYWLVGLSITLNVLAVGGIFAILLK